MWSPVLKITSELILEKNIINCQIIFYKHELINSQKVLTKRFRKKFHRQGAQILRNAACLRHAAVTKDAVQRSIWTFYETVPVARVVLI